MLFVAPSENESSDTKIASAFPNAGGGWTTSVRTDYLVADGINFARQQVLQGQNEFQFVYVPYDSQNLIGGHIDGATGNANPAPGQSKFNLAKTASGRYARSVLESDGTTKLTEDDGVLMLSVADTFDSDPTVGSEAILSYEYDPAPATL